jgi:hypothetical protein
MRIKWQNGRMKKSIANQLKNKAAIYYAVGIAVFTAIAGVIVTIIMIVNRNSM